MSTPNKWQKTVMTWDCGINGWETNIPVDDLKLDPKAVHRVENMKVVSITDRDEDESRYAIVTFQVFRGVIGPTTRRKEILSKLMTLDKEGGTRRVRVSTRDIGREFKISFNLTYRFCDDVIEFMPEFLAVLGIEDVHGYKISAFDISTQTMHRQGEGWIPFQEYFKLRKGIRNYNDLSVEIMPNTNLLTW